jgi:hypothetical protein
MEPVDPENRFIILGEAESYIVKDTATREFVAKNIPTIQSAERIRQIFEDNYTQEGMSK